MLKVRLGASVSTQFVTLRRVFIATLAMAAILVGIVAMHSAGMVHADSHSEPAASAELSALTVDTAVASAVAGHAHSETSTAVPLLSCDENCSAECALMALTCMVLFVLSTLILLMRFPSVYRYFIDRGHELIQVTPRAVAHIYSPSLTVLSISRT